MSKLLIEYILKENIVDSNVVEKLMSDLTRVHGIPRSKIRKIWKESEAEAGGNAAKAYEIAYPKMKALLPKKDGDESVEDLEGINLIDNPIPADTASPEPEEDDYTDEGFVDVLNYLSNLWRSKDRVRVIAKRFGIDPDLYAAAGLGAIPNDPSDEDIWNTMDASKDGQIPFVDSTWQPFYIDTLHKLQSLPDDVKQDIAGLMDKAKERRVQYESVKLVEDVAIFTDNGMEYITAGTTLKVERTA